MTDQAIDRPLELLNDCAEYLGLALCLTSSADVRGTFDGRKPATLLEGARLRMLAVVKPAAARDLTRWQRLLRGTTIVSANVDETRLDDAAMVLVGRLHALMNHRAA